MAWALLILGGLFEIGFTTCLRFVATVIAFWSSIKRSKRRVFSFGGIWSGSEAAWVGSRGEYANMKAESN